MPCRKDRLLYALLVLLAWLGLSPARAWDWSKPFIYEFRIALETDNWTNHYSTTTVLSKSDNTDAFRVVANSTVTPTYQLVVTTQGNVGIAISSPSYKLDVNGSVNAGAYYVNGTLLSSSGSSQWTTSDSNIYYNSGNIGIGTASPGTLLEVNGNTIVDGALLTRCGQLPGSAFVCASAISRTANSATFTGDGIQITTDGAQTKYNAHSAVATTETANLICRALGYGRFTSYTTTNGWWWHAVWSSSSKTWSTSYQVSGVFDTLTCYTYTCDSWTTCPD